MKANIPPLLLPPLNITAMIESDKSKKKEKERQIVRIPGRKTAPQEIFLCNNNHLFTLLTGIFLINQRVKQTVLFC